MSPEGDPRRIAGDGKAQKPLGMRHRVIHRDAAAGGRADGVKFLDAKISHERMQVVDRDARILPGGGIGAVIAAPRIADHPIACGCEHRLLIDPHQRAAGRRMQQHDGPAAAAGVPIEQPRAGQFRHTLLGGRLRGHRRKPGRFVGRGSRALFDDLRRCGEGERHGARQHRPAPRLSIGLVEWLGHDRGPHGSIAAE